MWSKVALLLAVVAVTTAEEWHYKSRMPTLTPNAKGFPFDKFVEEAYKPQVFIPGTKVVENCGNSPAQSARIVGGQEAIPNSWPWQVAIYMDDMYFCGGSIISENYVLTAAHCTDGISNFRIVAGAHNIRQDEPTQVTKTADSTHVTQHAEYGPVLIKNDISLIYIADAFDFSAPEIQPVCLPTRSQGDLGAGVIVTPSGWGKPSDDALGISGVLRQVDVPTMTSVDCAETYASVTQTVLCIDTTGGMGTCSGDSGGPLNHQPFGNATFVTQGVTSFGASAGCEVGYPAGFTRITSFLDWIETNSGIIIGD